MSRLAIILSSERLDKLYPAIILASTASSMGWNSELFFTFWALLALKRGYEPSQLTADYSDFRKDFLEALERGSMPRWRDMLREARETGLLKIYACTTTMQLLNIKKEDFEDFVDDMMGAATFLSKAKEADITLFIS